MFDYRELFARHGIAPRGVVHVGAHEGEELGEYLGAGATSVVFVEGDPVTFERLQAVVADHPHVRCLNALISDSEGVAQFHRTSSSQSSSLLRLGLHTKIYPSIVPAGTIALPTVTLDALLSQEGIAAPAHNVLAIDVQGAELQVLRGATATLATVDAIISEVNHAPLYEGCALVEELDDFLAGQGFRRVEETRPYHPSWGDALYVRDRRVRMSTLGRNGRFGNQLFQYLFLDVVARRSGRTIESPPWIGEHLFDLPSRRPSHTPSRRIRQDLEDPDPEAVLAEVAGRDDVDLWGYFQYHTRHLAPHRGNARELFSPRVEVRRTMDRGMDRLGRRGRTLVALHLRRGDYTGGPQFYPAPTQWYLETLDALWPLLDAPYLYVASDDLRSVLPDFAAFGPCTEQDLELDAEVPDVYPDFYVMSRARVLAISNSTYSFAASLLSDEGGIYLRPDPDLGRLVPYLPWSSPVLLSKGHRPSR